MLVCSLARNAQVLKCGVCPVSVRKARFVARQPRTNQMMQRPKTKCFHFLLRFIRRPALFGHSKGRDHHSDTVITQTAMYEYFLIRILTEQCKEAGKNFVFRKRTVPRYRCIFHPQSRHYLALMLS